MDERQHDGIDETESPESAVLTKRLREAEEHIRGFEQQGWQWRGKDQLERVLTHPDDRDLFICFDPYTAELLLSPKLVEYLKATIEHERQHGKMPRPGKESV